MNYLLELARTTHKRDLLWFGGYALYLVFSYMVFHSATVLSSAGKMDHASEVFFLVASLSARVVMFIVVACLVRWIIKVSNSILIAITGGIAVTGFLITAMVFQFSAELSTSMFLPWLIVGGVFLGIADMLITLVWARFSATLTLRVVFLYVVLCNAVSLAIYFVVTMLPIWTAIPVAAVLFLASAFFGKKALDSRAMSDWEYSAPVFKGAARRLAHPVLGASILSFMAGLMLQISGQQEITLEAFQHTSLLTSAVAILILLLPALFMKKTLNIGRMYALALPLSAAGFLLLPLIWNAAGGIVNSFAQLGAMVAGIILWCLLAETSYDTKLPSLLLFSIALACTNGAQLLGTLIGYFNADTLKQSDILMTAVALVAIYLLFMVALFLFKDKSLKGEEGLSAQGIESPEPDLHERCETLAEAHHFTPRESEIFVLLAQGYTIPAISEKLFVSENTVKSHVKSIYQKLDVHVRTELIELVNNV